MELSGPGGRRELSHLTEGPAILAHRGPSAATRRLRFLLHPPAGGAWNMAVDESLMDTARRGETTLRLYAWEPGCLSFGRNQTARGRYDGEAARRHGFDVVRRPTGGRSVLHYREITYSVTAPSDWWGSLGEAYLLINRALAAGLRELGVPALVASRDTGAAVPGPTVRACFRDPLPGEVTAGGRKLIGSAQWRDRGALLQHGSLLLHNDQAVVERLRTGDQPAPDVPAAGLAEFLDPLPEPVDVGTVLAAALGRALSLPVQAAELEGRESRTARELLHRYEDDAWTWRR